MLPSDSFFVLSYALMELTKDSRLVVEYPKIFMKFMYVGSNRIHYPRVLS